MIIIWNLKMRNRKIIKESLLFPFKKYKHFILVTALFLIMEFFSEFILHQHLNDDTITALYIVTIILPLLVLGINLQIIFHIIEDNRGLPKISIKKSFKDATNDLIIEIYYLALTVIITLILSIPTGIFHNLYDIYREFSLLTDTLDERSVFEIVGLLPDYLVSNYINSLTISIIIFIITFTALFSLCTLSKIDLEVTHDLKQSFNLKRIIKLVKKIGIIKYLGFLLLIIILSVITTHIIYHMEYVPILGSIISALLESFELFFFTYSFTQLYPS